MYSDCVYCTFGEQTWTGNLLRSAQSKEGPGTNISYLGIGVFSIARFFFLQSEAAKLFPFLPIFCLVRMIQELQVLLYCIQHQQDSCHMSALRIVD